MNVKHHVYLQSVRVQERSTHYDRGVELGCHNWMVCFAAELFLISCFSDTVFDFVTLFRQGVETAVSGVRRLLGSGGVLTSLTLLSSR